MLLHTIAINLTSTRNSTNQTLDKGPAEQKVLAFNTTNVVICFVAFVLNLAEAVLIIHQKQFKPFQRILLSLCCADVLVVVLYAIQKFYEKEHGEPIYSVDIMHLVGQPLEVFSVMSSITNIILLGIDRLLAVAYPLKHGIWMTNIKINFSIVGAWFLSILLSVMSNINRFAQPDDKTSQASETANYIFSGLLFSSGLFISIIYVLIVAKVLRRRKIASQLRGSGKADRSDETAVTITCMLVVIAFSICSYPYAIDILINPKSPGIPIKTILLNPLLDPLVYFFMGYLKRKLKSTKPKEKIEMKSNQTKTTGNTI